MVIDHSVNPRFGDGISGRLPVYGAADHVGLPLGFGPGIPVCLTRLGCGRPSGTLAGIQDSSLDVYAIIVWAVVERPSAETRSSAL